MFPRLPELECLNTMLSFIHSPSPLHPTFCSEAHQMVSRLPELECFNAMLLRLFREECQHVVERCDLSILLTYCGKGAFWLLCQHLVDFNVIHQNHNGYQILGTCRCNQEEKFRSTFDTVSYQVRASATGNGPGGGGTQSFHSNSRRALLTLRDLLSSTFPSCSA